MFSKVRLAEAHRPTWQGTWLWLALLATFLVLQGAILVCWLQGPFWVVPPLALLLAYVMHSHLLAFHEAAHRTLAPVDWLNDALGIFVGILGFMSLSLYRSAHRLHHAYLGTERDEELWPFVLTSAPRWQRRLAAFLELTLGLCFTPVLFLRILLRPGSQIGSARERRRIWLELGVLAVFWAGVAALTVWWQLWEFLFWMYLLPALLAGNTQSWRKYIEHMGMTGDTALGLTRSIVPRSSWKRQLLLTMYNEPYHGIHHRYGKLPGLVLPEFTAVLQPSRDEEPAPYPSYWHALGAMFASLADPRIGPQWREPIVSASRETSASQRPKAIENSGKRIQELRDAVNHAEHAQRTTQDGVSPVAPATVTALPKSRASSSACS
jgi:fatty acid desaturase